LNKYSSVEKLWCREQEYLGRVIPGGEETAEGINVWRHEFEYLSTIPYSTYDPYMRSNFTKRQVLFAIILALP